MKFRKTAAVILTATLLLSALSGCSSNKDPLKVAQRYVDAMFENDAKTMAKLTAEDFIPSSYKTPKLYEKHLEKVCEGIEKSMEKEYGDDWEYSTEAIDVYDSIFTTYDDETYDEIVIDTVTAAIEVTIEGEKGWLFTEDVADHDTFEIQLWDDGHGYKVIPLEYS